MRFSEARAWAASEAVPNKPPTHCDLGDLKHWRKVYRKEWGLDVEPEPEEYETSTSRSDVLRGNLSADPRRTMDRWLQPNNRGETL
jgi:hypothetical protein